MLPSFGGTGFGGLAAAPLLTNSPAAAAPEVVAPEPQRSSQAPLYGLIVLLILGMGGLAYYVVTRPEPEAKVVTQVVAPPVPAMDDDDDDDTPRKKKKKVVEDDEEEEEGDAEGEEETTPTGEKKAVKKTAVKTDKKGTTKTADKSGDKPAAGDDKPAADKPAAKPKEEEVSVECLLDPASCKKGGSGGSNAAKPPPDANLPATLDLADIKAGTSSTKAAAESSCKGKAKGGEKVKIKLSIEGPTGKVISSSPDSDGGNPALASCVAAELKKSTFKKVQKAQIGTVVSVSF